MKKAAKKSDILFDFNDAKGTTRGSKKAATAFKNAGNPVINMDVVSKLKSTAGMKYRQIFFYFGDSQNVEVQVKETGDVFKVKINNREFPITEQDDHRKAVKEISQALDAGRTAFQKKLVKATVRLPPKRKTANKDRLVQLQEKSQALDEAIDAAEIELAELKAA